MRAPVSKRTKGNMETYCCTFTSNAKKKKKSNTYRTKEKKYNVCFTNETKEESLISMSTCTSDCFIGNC